MAPALYFGRTDLSRGATDFLGEPAEVLDGEVHFALGFGEPFAGLQSQGVGQFVAPFGEEVRRVPEQVGSDPHCGLGPRGECFGSGVGGPDGVVRCSPGNFADGVAVSGIQDVLGIIRGQPSAVHQVLS